MELIIENGTTIQEIKATSEWHLKQSKKFDRMFRSEFSRAEKDRVENLKEGKASTMLNTIALCWLSNHSHALTCEKEYLIKNQPCLKTLLGEDSEFSTLKPYYNQYFAHWYYKKNWQRIVEKFCTYGL